MKQYTTPVIIGLVILMLTGCAGMKPTVFVHPEYNFGYVERVAIIPFENLSSDQGAAHRATRLFMSELLATEAFDVVEPGEVTRSMNNNSVLYPADITRDQIITMGKELGVQAFIIGTLNESTSIRSGGTATSVVTLVVRMVETDSGQTVWSSTHTEGGRGFWSSLFGTGGKSTSEVTRNCVKRAIKTLVD